MNDICLWVHVIKYSEKTQAVWDSHVDVLVTILMSRLWISLSIRTPRPFSDSLNQVKSQAKRMKNTKYLSVIYTALSLTKRNNSHSKLLLSWRHEMKCTVKLISWHNKYQRSACFGKIINHVSFQTYKTLFFWSTKRGFWRIIHVKQTHQLVLTWQLVHKLS